MPIHPITLLCMRICSASSSNFWKENFLNFTLVVCFYQILKNSIAFVPEKIRLIFCRGIISFVSTCGQNPGCFTPAAKLVFYQRQTYVLPMPRAVFCWPASDNAPPTTGFCPNIKTNKKRWADPAPAAAGRICHLGHSSRS